MHEHTWEFLAGYDGLFGESEDVYRCTKCMKIRIEERVRVAT